MFLGDLYWVHFCLEFTLMMYIAILIGDRGSTVVKVLCYKSEGRWFDPSWCYWNSSLTKNPSDRTMVLGPTQTEMSTGAFPGVNAAGA